MGPPAVCAGAETGDAIASLVVFGAHCANMALSNYKYLIPLDEVIDTMKEVGDRIHHTLRCTNLGGLSTTRSAKIIEHKLEEQPGAFFKSC